MLEHTIGVDLGTTGARAVRIDGRGALVASETATYPLLTPQPGWTEQEPEDWWRAALTALRAVVAAGDAPVGAVGVTGQMHGAVFLDEHDESIRPAILWNDQRTARAAQTIEDVVGRSRLGRITGNRALTGFQAPKILWLREAIIGAVATRVLTAEHLPLKYAWVFLVGLAFGAAGIYSMQQISARLRRKMVIWMVVGGGVVALVHRLL